jgi:Bacterial conjugation TrbI-like protein
MNQNSSGFKIEDFWQQANAKVLSQQKRKLHPLQRFFLQEVPPEHEGGEPLFRPYIGRIVLGLTGVLACSFLLTTRRLASSPSAPRPVAALPESANRANPANYARSTPPQIPRIAGQAPPTPAYVPPSPARTMTIPPMPPTAMRPQIIPPPPMNTAYRNSGNGTDSKDQRLRTLLAERAQDKPLYTEESASTQIASATPTLNTSLSTQQPRRRLSAGSTIQASLPLGISGQASGSASNIPVTAEVTEPVVQDGEVLIPTGSRLQGVVTAAAGGRVQMIFSILVTPDNREHRLDGAIAEQQGAIGVVAEVSDNRRPDAFSGFLGNMLTEAGTVLQQPQTASSFGGTTGSFTSVNNAPIDQRLQGSMAKALGTTLQQNSQYQRQALSSQPITFRAQPQQFTVRLTKGMDL